MSRSRARSAILSALVVALLAPAGATAHDGPGSLAGDSLRAPLTRESFYFVMPDRFENGSTANDRGGLTGPREVTGFDPTSKGWYLWMFAGRPGW